MSVSHFTLYDPGPISSDVESGRWPNSKTLMLIFSFGRRESRNTLERCPHPISCLTLSPPFCRAEALTDL